MSERLSDPNDALLVICNPISGKGRAAVHARIIANYLIDAGRQVDIVSTSRKGEAADIARRVLAGGLRYQTIVACGGDGTIQETSAALFEAKRSTVALGLAPAGRCNDFARALRIPLDPIEQAKILLHGLARPLDVGTVNGRVFCTVLTSGIDAAISQFVERMKMPLRGTPAYLYGLLRVLPRYRPNEIRIRGDFGAIDKPVFIASVANTSSYGGAIPIAPRANPFDGWMDLCLIDSMSWNRTALLLPKILRGTHERSPLVQMVRTRKFTLETADPIALWADGEPIAETPAVVEIAPGAMLVMTPNDLSFSNA